MPDKPKKMSTENLIIVRAGEEMMNLIKGIGHETRLSKASLVRTAMHEFFSNHEDIEGQILACGRNGGPG